MPPASPRPDPDLGQSRWPQDTYAGRLRHFAALTSPLNLLAGATELAAAQDLVRRHQAGDATGATAAQLWAAKTLVDSTLHPDTGEPVLLPFRLSCFVPTNMFIVAGMLVPNASVGGGAWDVCGQSVSTVDLTPTLLVTCFAKQVTQHKVNRPHQYSSGRWQIRA